MKLAPLAHTNNTRLVLVNRRDYPGSLPYSDDERNLLLSCFEPASSDEVVLAKRREKLLAFMKNRAREIYDFLEELVAEGDIPVAQKERNTGGIIVVGWSFGSTWMLALLASVGSFPVNDIALSRYVRRVICHGMCSCSLDVSLSFKRLSNLDPGWRLFGYQCAAVPDPYSPLLDTTIANESLMNAFNIWASGYFAHGETPETFAYRTPLVDPSPTSTRLTPDELASMCDPSPGEAGVGSDSLLFRAGGAAGLYTALRAHALYLLPPPNSASLDPAAEGGDTWEDVEVRVLWCTQSVWEVAWLVTCLREEMATAKAQGRPMRDVRIVRVNGNHFVRILL